MNMFSLCLQNYYAQFIVLGLIISIETITYWQICLKEATVMESGLCHDLLPSTWGQPCTVLDL